MSRFITLRFTLDCQATIQIETPYQQILDYTERNFSETNALAYFHVEIDKEKAPISCPPCLQQIWAQ